MIRYITTPLRSRPAQNLGVVTPRNDAPVLNVLRPGVLVHTWNPDVSTREYVARHLFKKQRKSKFHANRQEVSFDHSVKWAWRSMFQEHHGRARTLSSTSHIKLSPKCTDDTEIQSSTANKESYWTHKIPQHALHWLKRSQVNKVICKQTKNNNNMYTL